VAATDFLLTTKLYLPPRRSRLVHRSRLCSLLDEGLTRPLTLVSAPAGFGKTTLLSEWRDTPAGRDYPLAWLSLDQDDNDPSTFLLYLITALGTLEKGMGASALATLQSQQTPSVQAILTSLVNDLGTLRRDCALILDDYHVITAGPVHAALQFLLETMPAHFHLVLLTRADPPLPLARLRARDQLTEIRLPVLRFLPEEAAQFLNEVMCLGLSLADITALESRTEGWIAGLQLAAVSLQQLADRHAFVAAFAGDDRYVMDYLLEEVLQRQSPEVQSFLLKTSILERLNESLCRAVTGQAGCQSILENLEQANLFVAPLDNKRYWFRCHPLFADLLRHRLRQLMPAAEWMQYYQNACEWYESNGLISEAVSQGFASADLERAADVLERHVLTVFYRGETMLVHHWLQALPEALLKKRPLLCAMYANTIAHSGMFDGRTLAISDHWLGMAEDSSREADSTTLTRCFIGLSRAYLAHWKGEPPQTVIRLAQKALADLPAETEKDISPNFIRFRSGLSNNLGISYLALGDEETAIRAFSEAQRIGEACGDLLNMYSSISSQAFILRRHGCLKEAAALCRQALEKQASAGVKVDKPFPYVGVVYVSLGRILLEWNDLDGAERALATGLELSRLTAASDGVVESIAGLAMYKFARGDIPGAVEQLNTVTPDSPKARLLIPMLRIRLDLARSSEDPHYLREALRWAEDRSFSYSDLDWQMVELLTLARVRIAGRRDAAQSVESAPVPDLTSLMQFLQEQLESAEKQQRVEWSIELGLLQALAWQAQNRWPEALGSLSRALELAEPCGYVRIFLDEGLPLRRLLVKIKARSSRISAYVEKLLEAGGWGETGQSSKIQQNSLVEPLSPRELEVLRLLVEGSSNADIARKLFITLNTTKKHVTHIFEKLAISDRAAAVRRARDLGLLPLK
jgi:LuxR family transcriptional regulator, maltose regulon positive regulatory protein